jgi:hypothetical protein
MAYTPAMSLAIPTWIGAIATAGLLIGSGVTAVYAARAFSKQSQQLKDQQKINSTQTVVLELQARELRESLEERKRDQAARIFIELTGSPPPTWVTVEAGQPEPEPLPWRFLVTVSNTSSQPVYDLEVRWQLGTQPLDTPGVQARLMPDRTARFERSHLLLSSPHLPVNPGVISAVLVFRDAAGARWRSRLNGKLEEIAQTVTGVDLAGRQKRQQASLSSWLRRPRSSRQVDVPESG